MKPKTAQIGTENGSLKPLQENVAMLLASGSSQTKAASESGAGLRTVKSWMKQPAFSRRVQQLRGEMSNQAIGQLVNSMVGAAETLSDLSRQGRTESIKLAASRTILEFSTRFRETIEIEQRIAALENGKNTE